jgi:hypothetical protein
MCFNNPTTKKPKIAKEDISCYKCLKGDNSPRYGGDGTWTHQNTTPYVKNKLSPPVSLSLIANRIYEGYHSCNSNIDADVYTADSFKTVIRKFVIPTGTKYFENKYGDYVSETIMLVE